MITGAHSIIYSKDPEADRAFVKDVLQLKSVDLGEGWLIFGIPSSELAFHPSDSNDVHEFYFVCDSIIEFVGRLREEKVPFKPIEELSWGKLVKLRLPGGGELGVYEPSHLRP